MDGSISKCCKRILTLVALILTAGSRASELITEENLDLTYGEFQGRKLLVGSQCQLVVSGQTFTYNACQSLESAIGFPMTIYYSVSAGVAGGPALLTGGFDATWDGWAGFGFPEFPESMIGSNVVIAQPNSASANGASIDKYALVTTSRAPTAGTGSLVTGTGTDFQAQSAGGHLKARFTLQLSKTLAAIQTGATQDIVFAAGPVRSGILQQHSLFNSGGLALNLGLGLASAPSVAPAPLIAPASPPPRALTPPPAAAPQQGCALTIAGVTTSFGACQTVTSAAGQMTFSWQFSAGKGLEGGRRLQQAGGTLTAAIDSASLGWAAFGFAKDAGVMAGTDAFFVSTCGTNTVNTASCPNGATVQGHTLDAGSLGGASKLTLISWTAQKTASGRLQAVFKIAIPAGSPIGLPGANPILFCQGPVGADGTLQQHILRNALSGSIDFVSGSASSVTVATKSSKSAIHGWLMAISWGFLIPIGVMSARYLKEHDPLWFHLHRGIQTVGFVIGVVGIGLGISIRKSPRSGNEIETMHIIFGYIILVLGTLQVVALVFRPAKDASIRKVWNVCHHWSGRLALLLAFVNVFLGLQNGIVSLGYKIAYAVVLGVLAMVCVGMETRKGSAPRPTKLPGAIASDGKDPERGSASF